MKKKPARTRTGRVLSDEELDALAAEVESTNYDVAGLRARRRGRPPMGSGPAAVVPVRLDPELRAALEAHATATQASTSDVIRIALRRYLKVR
jgi:CRISPR-associated endonuclease/helicase Cas3